MCDAAATMSLHGRWTVSPWFVCSHPVASSLLQHDVDRGAENRQSGCGLWDVPERE